MHRKDDGPQKGSLYVVATPIGNLRDITLRALDVLASVDVIAAEDTRTTGRLLDAHSIRARLISLHQHNERAAAEKVVALLAQGKSVALVSDAGTPGLSDPGALAVARAREEGCRVVPVPGPAAAACALSAAGVPSARFLFYGFLPAKAGQRRRELEAVKNLPFGLIFYEAPHRIAECLADLAKGLGAERTVTLARELTKLFEEIHTCALGGAQAWLEADAHRGKGEYVLVVWPPAAVEQSGLSDAARRALEVLAAELPLKQASRLTAAITGENKKALYDYGLGLKPES